MKALKIITILIASAGLTGIMLNHFAAITVSYWWFIAPMAAFAFVVLFLVVLLNIFNQVTTKN